MIEEYHNGFKATDTQPPMDLGEDKIDQLPNLDPEGKFIVSTRIRCGRSLQGYPFNPCLTEANYKNMEERMKKARESLPLLQALGLCLDHGRRPQGNLLPLDGHGEGDAGPAHC